MSAVLPGRRLTAYVAGTFLRWIGSVFLLGAGIIFIADTVEMIRRSVDRAGFDAASAVLASLYKTPSLTEEFLPFAVLFGAIGAFLALNRRLELVVLRAAGISVWQFLGPGLLVAASVGILATTLYNPLSASAREASEALAASLLGKEARMLTGGGRTTWFRQEGPDGGSLVHAGAASTNGLTLFEVEVHRLDADGRFAGRLEATRAELTDGAWQLTDVTRYDREGVRSTVPALAVPTSLTAAEVRDAVTRPDAVSFWNLPDAASVAERAGLPTHRFELQHQVLLARPLLLTAMVMIAASVSLKLTRLGGLSRAVTGGVVAGFALFIGTAVASDLGEANAVPPVLAAWLPGLAAVLFGATALLWTEDG